MKANYPKALWVAFNGLMKPCDVGKVMCKGWYFKRKLYYLHPGNEVARALNVLNTDSKWMDVEHFATKLRKAGFPVRWDAKKGKFK